MGLIFSLHVCILASSCRYCFPLLYTQCTYVALNTSFTVAVLYWLLYTHSSGRGGWLVDVALCLSMLSSVTLSLCMLSGCLCFLLYGSILSCWSSSLLNFCIFALKLKVYYFKNGWAYTYIVKYTLKLLFMLEPSTGPNNLCKIHESKIKTK